jgi:hypothetical protein
MRTTVSNGISTAPMKELRMRIIKAMMMSRMIRPAVEILPSFFILSPQENKGFGKRFG